MGGPEAAARPIGSARTVLLHALASPERLVAAAGERRLTTRQLDGDALTGAGAALKLQIAPLPAPPAEGAAAAAAQPAPRPRRPLPAGDRFRQATDELARHGPARRYGCRVSAFARFRSGRAPRARDSARAGRWALR